jgi:hypothetical protein
MSQDPTEPADEALQAIDRYITEGPATPCSDTQASQPQRSPQQLSLSQRLQALGQQRAATFTPLLDFQNAQSAQHSPSPLLPNEF